MIVRDEAAFLPECLESLDGVVDEVVVVDTGSTDNTPDIAAAYGARVYHETWRDDFSRARNQALDRARGEWILYIDADERLVGAERSNVERLLVDAEEVAFRILLQPTLNATPYREFRLWRNDPRIRFKGVIHEKVIPSIYEVAASDGRTIGFADLLLVHLGYEGDQTRKHHRNLPLLQREIEAEPSNLFVRHHLARVLVGLGDREGAEKVLLDAIEFARSHGWADHKASLVCVELVRLWESEGRSITALLEESRAAFPDNCVLLWIDARTSVARGDFRRAISLLDQLLATDWTYQRDFGPAYDRRLVCELPNEVKGLCHFRLGEYEAAQDCYRRAAACAPENPAYEVKANLAASRARVSTVLGSSKAVHDPQFALLATSNVGGA